MIIKSQDVIGLKVMSMDSGKFVETVRDVIYDPKSNRVLALLISEGGWLSSGKVILFEDINSIGKDAVVIQNEENVKSIDDVEDQVGEIAESDVYLTKTKIVTEGGEELGSVKSIYFDDQTGQVLEFEVTGGAIKDIKEGTKRVRISDIITVGTDATIVKSYTVQAVESQAEHGGLQGKVEELKEKAGEALNNVKDKAQEVAMKAQYKAEEAANDPQNKQRVEDLKSKVQEARDTVGQKLNEAREQIPQKAADARDAASEKVGQAKEGVNQQLMDNAAGQVLTKTIYNPANNEVIGELGDEVDYEMLNRAKEAGVLEQVTQNVQKPLD